MPTWMPVSTASMPRLDRMERKQDKMWGEIGNQRGEVFERLAINALGRWLDHYCWEREWPEPEFEVLWSERNDTTPNADRRWRSVAQDLGIPVRNPALRQCDILLRATWPQPPHSSMHTVLLITGEVSTQLNQRRQEKVVRQYAALAEAGYAVLPVLVGLRHRTFVSIPHLMDVHLTEEELTDLRDLPPPNDLYTLLDRLLDRPRRKDRSALGFRMVESNEIETVPQARQGACIQCQSSMPEV